MHAKAVAIAALVLVAGCLQADGNETSPAPGADGTGASSASGTTGSSGSGVPGSGGPSTATSSASSSGTSSSSPSGTGVTYTIPRSLHESTWLCQTVITVDDATSGGTDDQQCKVTLSFSDTQVTVQSTGIPNHDYESGGGCCAKTRSLTNTFPLKPQLATSVTYAPERGSIATAVNGVEIYGPEDADDADVVIVTYSSPTAQPRLEMCDAHSTPNSQGGAFHYHADANCIHWHAGSGETWSDYDFSKVDTTVHSRIIAWAPDGFPIYGTYGYASDGVTVKEIKSSYRLKSGASGSTGIDDQEYIAGLGDLDECNGRTSKTPEFPDGIYHYYSTKHNGEGGWGFPYFPLCYKGVVVGSTGLQGGGTQSGGGMTGTSSQSMSGQPPPASGSQSMSGSSTCPPPPPPGSPPPSGPPPAGCPTPTGSPP
jgi:hypothetical protein